ncbi:MAG: Ig-like domain-containing protein [Verrucomicrobiales bacterium]|nr:Ig-like domain-containing protein [Verrucomicrobiales bacterium]
MKTPIVSLHSFRRPLLLCGALAVILSPICLGALRTPTPRERLLARFNEPLRVGFNTSIPDDEGGATNIIQQAFEEREGVRLTSSVWAEYRTTMGSKGVGDLRSVTIPAGTVVNSYFIFHNPFRATVKRDDNIWEFEVGERILGVMADNDGTLEVASSSVLGRPSLYAAGAYPYWKSNNRGFEGRVNDGWEILAANRLRVYTEASRPGDYLRVVTTIDNRPPIVQPIPNQTMLEDGRRQIVLGVSDDRTPNSRLTYAVQSSNPALLPASAITVTVTGEVPRMTIPPLPDQFGVARIELRVGDEQGLVTTVSFAVTVVPVNDTPTLYALAPLTLDQDSGEVRVALTGISAGAANEVDQFLTVSASSDNAVVIAEPMVEYASPAAQGTLRLRPVPGRNGRAVITVTVKDDGGVEFGAVDTISRQFSVTVNPVVLPNLPPAVNLTRPTNGQRFEEPAAIQLEAVATDQDGQVRQVEFFAEGAPLGVVTSAPFQLLWQGVVAGTYRLTAHATDDDDAVARSTTVVVTVLPQPTPPTVSFVHPVGGQLVARNRLLRLEVIAHDMDGEVAGVAFYRTGSGPTDPEIPIGTVTQPPFVMDYPGIGPEGSYTFVAVATDDDGLSTRSAPVSVEAIGGDILLIGSPDDPEIGTLSRYLSAAEEFQIPSPTSITAEWYEPDVRIVEAAQVNPAMAEGFRMLISADVGTTLGGIAANVVETLWQGWQSGVAVYLMGERLALAADELSGATRQRWTGLIGLSPVPGETGPGFVQRLEPANRVNEFFGSNFPPGSSRPGVTDFCYPRALPRVAATGGGEVRATLGDSPVLLRYPGFDEPENPFLGFRVVQGFLVAGGQPSQGGESVCTEAEAADSLVQRRLLFQNAVLWLLGAHCENFVTSLTPPPATQLKPCVPTELIAVVSNNGACAAGGVVVTQTIPEGLRVLDAWIEADDSPIRSPRVRVGKGEVIFGVGQVGGPGRVALHSVVVAEQPTEASMFYTVNARFQHPSQHAIEVTGGGTPCACPRLAAEWTATGLRLVVRGSCAVRTILEQSPDLENWTPVMTNGELPDGHELLRIAPGGVRAFYRLVVPVQ